MKSNLYPEYNLEIFDEYNGKSIDFKKVLTKNGFNNDIADYILKQMYYQSYINPVNWECYCNMNNEILKLKQEHQEYFENEYNEVMNMKFRTVKYNNYFTTTNNKQNISIWDIVKERDE